MLPGDVSGTYWQNEDMDLDVKRKRVFLARDRRAYNGTTSDPNSFSGVIYRRRPGIPMISGSSPSTSYRPCTPGPT